MSADNHANYARVGFTIIIGIIAIIATLIYIGGDIGGNHEFMTETYSDNSVSGLASGSGVFFRGVKIGEVRDINFVSFIYDDVTWADAQRIRITMAIDTRKIGTSGDSLSKMIEKYVKRGMRATVSANAITGIARVELSIPENPEPMPTLTWRPEYTFVPPQPSLFNNLAKSVTLALDKFNTYNFNSIWTNFQTIASSVANLSQEIQEIIVNEKGSISSTIRNIDEMSSQLRDLATELRNNPSMLLRANDPQVLPETSR